MKAKWFSENMEAHRAMNEAALKENYAFFCKKKPHLRRESGHWLCTESRKERNILRGTLGDTPCQAFYYFMHRQNMLRAKEIFAFSGPVTPYKFPVPYWS